MQRIVNSRAIVPGIPDWGSGCRHPLRPARLMIDIPDICWGTRILVPFRRGDESGNARPGIFWFVHHARRSASRFVSEGSSLLWGVHFGCNFSPGQRSNVPRPSIAAYIIVSASFGPGTAAFEVSCIKSDWTFVTGNIHHEANSIYRIGRPDVGESDGVRRRQRRGPGATSRA